MERSRTGMTGWFVAAALGGILLGSGFQAPSLKFAVVDLARVVDESNLGKQYQATLGKMKSVREEALTFIDTYRVLTPEQAARIRELILNLSRTKAEDAELERIKAEVIASSKRSKELSTKATLTPEERTLIEEYARRSQNMNETAQRWLREFTNEIESYVTKERQTSLERAQAAVNEVSAKEGYTLVFEKSIVPYGANDVSPAVLAAMNAKP